MRLVKESSRAEYQTGFGPNLEGLEFKNPSWDMGDDRHKAAVRVL